MKPGAYIVGIGARDDAAIIDGGWGGAVDRAGDIEGDKRAVGGAGETVGP